MQNTSRGKGKVFILLGVLLTVAGLTLGFAAFSNTLTIKSSATVTPDSDTFKVVFSSRDTELKTDEIEPEGITDGMTASNAIINNTGNPTLSGMKVNFTSPGQSANYVVYVRNEGEYDAYLNEVKLNNVTGKNSRVVCTADTDENGNPLATQSLVDEACASIVFSIPRYEDLEGNIDNKMFFQSQLTSGLKIGKNEAFRVIVLIEYLEDGIRADGPFTVSFGDIEFVYSTVDVNAN